MSTPMSVDSSGPGKSGGGDNTTTTTAPPPSAGNTTTASSMDINALAALVQQYQKQQQQQKHTVAPPGLADAVADAHNGSQDSQTLMEQIANLTKSLEAERTKSKVLQEEKKREMKSFLEGISMQKFEEYFIRK